MEDNKKKIILVGGARPNFMKIAPLMKELKNHPSLQALLVHTGQHYDYNMNDVFFRDLEIPRPDYFLGVGSGTHAEQTGKIMIEFEKILMKEKPDMIVVVGDVNSTIACSLTAAKLCIPVAHVEAGLRGFDMSIPEEINRILTDHVAGLLFTTTKYASGNLIKEGIAEERIFLVGDTMLDSIVNNLDKCMKKEIKEINENLEKEKYAVLTLHRSHNVDNKECLSEILEAIAEIQKYISVIFPMHPRTKKMLKEFNLEEKINAMRNLIVTEPLNYLDFMSLVINSKLLLTDSGGIQNETSFLGIPCITLRESTDRPETINEGTNTITGHDKNKIISKTINVLNKNTNKKDLKKIKENYVFASKFIIQTIDKYFADKNAI